MGKIDNLNNFFNVIDAFKGLEYKELYNILYKTNCSINKDTQLANLLDKINASNKSIVKNNIIINEGLESNYERLLIRLDFVIKYEQVDESVNKLISYLKKKKIKFGIKIVVYDEICRLNLTLSNRDYLIKIVDFINDRIGKNLEFLNSLTYKDDGVGLSFDCEYSYDEVLTMYLYNYINMDSNYKVHNYINFKKYILDIYFKLENQIDMYQFMKFNHKGICLSKYFNNLFIMTNLIVFLINEKDVEDYDEYVRLLFKNESKKVNNYGIYDNLDDNSKLLEELVSSMYFKYGDEHTKNSLINYINTGKRSYITRDNDLRKRIIASKTFMVYLYSIDFDMEYNRIMSLYTVDRKKKLLEDICKETYMNCNDVYKENSGKIHIARTLIRISYGDYSSVTRKNDARKIAVENIKPEDVVLLIKETLKIDYVKKESSLYELYADYIEKLCIV